MPVIERTRLRHAVANWSVPLLLLGGPCMLFVLLMSRPDLDPAVGSPSSHFYIVSAAAGLAVVLAAAVLAAARRLPDPRTFFLALGFLSIATIFLAHGVGTSPLFKQSHATHSGTAAHSVGGYTHVVPEAPPTPSPEEVAAQRATQAARGRVVGYSARLSILVSALCFALAVVDLRPRIASLILRYRWILTVLATAILGGHAIVALWYPSIIAWVPVNSAPLSQAIALVAWVALGFAAWRFHQAYRMAILPLQGAMAIAMVLLMEAQLFMLFGRMWQLSWWEYHVVMFTGFLIAVIALLRQYRVTGDLGAIVEGLFLRQHVVQIRKGDPLALSALTAAIAAKDTETAEHIGRVGDLAVAVARQLELPEGRLELVRLAGRLHDVGKIGVPDSILRKPGLLTHREFEIVKAHSPRGGALALHSELLAEIAPIIRAHHERMDGRGYPDGLAGEAIPLEARIVAVADVWDALTCDRPYRGAMSQAAATEIMRAASGPHLDPACVEALLGVIRSGAQWVAA